MLAQANKDERALVPKVVAKIRELPVLKREVQELRNFKANQTAALKGEYNEVQRLRQMLAQANKDERALVPKVVAKIRELPVLKREVQELRNFKANQTAALKGEYNEVQRLRQMLAQANKDEQELVPKVMTKMREFPVLKRELRELRSVKANQTAALAAEYDEVQVLQSRLDNATQAASRDEKQLQLLGSRMASQQHENTALLSLLKNATDTIRGLRAARSQEEEREKEQAKAAESQVESLQTAFATTKQGLQQELAAAKESYSHQREITKKMAAGLFAAAQANASRSQRQVLQLAARVHALRKKAKSLRRQVSDEEHARQLAQSAMQSAKQSIERADVELKQLRGSVKWLEEAKASREQEQVRNAESQARRAMEERDAEKAMLMESQRKMAKLEQQYANAVQMFAQEENSGDTDVAAPVGAASGADVGRAK
eukprot:CAMPEP_0117529870 /NCGR_PEP_ID=MMETSP0784-20121206/38053_1 /TAXON_ID=39447 /ORGANISM="" /LENGTH=431 /DNA_ID=CAMNT_0005326201 /DNA_START=1 /DNA_END=1297 /DNA_ORIENTATION=+